MGPAGVVESWAWVAEPRERHPLKRPFAFALILLDGADTQLLHVVDTGDEAAMATGLRVTATWVDEPVGANFLEKDYEDEMSATQAASLELRSSSGPANSQFGHDR